MIRQPTEYMVYPNESIDKLSVNRAFERLFEDIDAETSGRKLVLSEATERSYGTAKFSTSASYSFSASDDGDYSGSMLGIRQLDDLSERLSDGSSSYYMVAPSSESLASTRYWIRSDFSDAKFVFMPNGVNVVTCTFDLGFNGLCSELGDGILRSDVVSPITLGNYPDTIDIDRESRWNVEDFISDGYGSMEPMYDVSSARGIFEMDGRTMHVPFAEPAKVTLRHNRCLSTTESAYEQSYVEVCMSMDISVRQLFERKYGVRIYEDIDKDSVVHERRETHGEMNRPYRLFTVKPSAMGQIGFYTNDSSPKPLFGFDNEVSDEKTYLLRFGGNIAAVHSGDTVNVNGSLSSVTFSDEIEQDVDGRIVIVANANYSSASGSTATATLPDPPPTTAEVERKRSSFSSHSRISHSPVDEVEVDGNIISPVNGSVMIKGVDNEFDTAGNVVDNIVHVAVTMKFMAGSPSDPEMEYALRRLNSRSRVQLVLIGV